MWRPLQPGNPSHHHPHHQSSLHTGRGLAPLYGIFGLGTPELVVIALVAGIVLVSLGQIKMRDDPYLDSHAIVWTN